MRKIASALVISMSGVLALPVFAEDPPTPENPPTSPFTDQEFMNREGHRDFAKKAMSKLKEDHLERIKKLKDKKPGGQPGRGGFVSRDGSTPSPTPAPTGEVVDPNMGQTAHFRKSNGQQGMVQEQNTYITFRCYQKDLPRFRKVSVSTQGGTEIIVGSVCDSTPDFERISLEYCYEMRDRMRTCRVEISDDYRPTGILPIGVTFTSETQGGDRKMNISLLNCNDNDGTCDVRVQEFIRMVHDKNTLELGGTAFRNESLEMQADGRGNIYSTNAGAFDETTGEYIPETRNPDGTVYRLNRSRFQVCDGSDCTTDSDVLFEHYWETGDLAGRETDSQGQTVNFVSHGSFNPFGYQAECRKECSQYETHRTEKTLYCQERNNVLFIEHQHDVTNYRCDWLRNTYAETCEYRVYEDEEYPDDTQKQAMCRNIAPPNNCWMEYADTEEGTDVNDPNNPLDDRDWEDVTEHWTCDDRANPVTKTCYINNEEDVDGAVEIYEALPQAENARYSNYPASDFQITNYYQEDCADNIEDHPDEDLQRVWSNSGGNCMAAHWRWYEDAGKISDNDEEGVSGSDKCEPYEPGLENEVNKPNTQGKRLGGCEGWGGHDTGSGSAARRSLDCTQVIYTEACEMGPDDQQYVCNDSSDPQRCREAAAQCQQYRESGCQEVEKRCIEHYDDRSAYDSDTNICKVYEYAYSCEVEEERCVQEDTVCQQVEGPGESRKDGGFEKGMEAGAFMHEMGEAMKKCRFETNPQKEEPIDVPPHRRIELEPNRGEQSPVWGGNDVPVCEFELFGGTAISCEDPIGNSVGLSADCCNINMTSSTKTLFNQCEDDEVALAAARRGYRNIHMGNYCSQRLEFAFISRCVETTQVHCAFDSRLSAEINRQGREQLRDLRGGGYSSLEEYEFDVYLPDADKGAWLELGVYAPPGEPEKGTHVMLWQWPAYCSGSHKEHSSSPASYRNARDPGGTECIDSPDVIFAVCREPNSEQCAYPENWKHGGRESGWEMFSVDYREAEYHQLGEMIAIDGGCEQEEDLSRDEYDGNSYAWWQYNCKYNVAFDERAEGNKVRRTYEIAWPLRTEVDGVGGAVGLTAVWTEKRNFGYGWGFRGEQVDIYAPHPLEIQIRLYSPEAALPTDVKVTTVFDAEQEYEVGGRDLKIQGTCSQQTNLCIYRIVEYIEVADKHWFPNRPLQSPPWRGARATEDRDNAGFTDCSGFTLEEFEMLDISSMDLSGAMSDYLADMRSTEEYRSTRDEEVTSFNEQHEEGEVRGSDNTHELVRLTPDNGETGWTMTLRAAANYPSSTNDDPDRTIPVEELIIDWGEGEPPETVEANGNPITATHTYGPPRTDPEKNSVIYHDVVVTFVLEDDEGERKVRARAGTWRDTPPKDPSKTGSGYGGENTASPEMRPEF